MKYFDYDSNIKISKIDSKYIDIDNSIFFDIETTGFSAKSSYIYIIGCAYKHNSEDTLHIKQWFLDDINHEKELILDFLDFLKNFKTIITFNGNGFDIPFITQKLERYKIKFDFSDYNSIDLYKEAYKLRNILKLENLKQKTIENFLGLHREDKFSGGDLISVYYAYMEKKDKNLLKVLLLHNFEDVKAMPVLLNIFAYSEIFSGENEIINYEIYDTKKPNNTKEFIITGKLNTSIKERISFGNSIYYFTAYNDTFKLKVEIYTGGLKFFYKEYKDYYYLPDEDCAIHKSVAFYVDKNYKTKAKAANCYSKKTGTFLPQPIPCIEPYFKIEYNDKTTYIELCEDFTSENIQLQKYVHCILNYLLTH